MAKKKLLIAAGLVASFAALLMFLFLMEKEKQTKEYHADDIEVVHALTDIPAGSPLTQDRVEIKKVPQRFLPANPLLYRDLATYLEMPVSETLKKGAMILTSDFAVAEVARTLSGRIPQGERAMSIPVDAISGVSGLLRPGDRIDVLGTFPMGNKDEVVPEAGGDGVGYVTMNLLQNVTLLAVGQEISDIAADSRQQRGAYSTVTASLTPDESELLTIAQTRGKLTLLLRHRDDLDTITVKRRTLRSVLEELDIINKLRVSRVEVKKVAPRGCASGFKRGPGGECIPELEIIRGKSR